MSDEIIIAAEPRAEFGKGFARRLRAAGKVPGVIYSSFLDTPIHFAASRIDIHALLRNHGTNAVFELDIEGDKHLVMVKHVDQNVITLNADHIDLLAIKRGEKVEVDVPVVFEGEPTPGTMLVQDSDTVLVEADVLSIPEEITFNIEGLDVDSKVTAADLVLPAKVTLVADPETVLATINREAVVEDKPGVTRDRVSYKAEWLDKRFTLVDTGGWESDARGIDARVADQAEIAVEQADVVILVVDARVGITASDEQIVRMLRRVKKPIILMANKIDDAHLEPEIYNLWSLGMGQPFPVSGLHGRGLADALDELLEVMPEHSQYAQPDAPGGPRRVALIGRPNVGKSSLLNKIAGEERSVVDDVAGTTVDPVDSLVQLDGHLWKFIDTAGLRKKVKNAQGHEYYASLRTRGVIDAAEVCLFMIDSSEPVSEQDQRVLSMILDAGKALVLVFNKWDLMTEDRRWELERDIEQQLAHIPWVRRVNISAKTGRALQKLEPYMEEALENWDKRITTGQLNTWLRATMAQNPPPMKGGRIPRVLFATQASTQPPVIVLFTTGFLDAGYRRYLERKFREAFGFEGTPVRIAVRVRERRQK